MNRRDFFSLFCSAASLLPIGCGWLLPKPAPAPLPPLSRPVLVACPTCNGSGVVHGPRGRPYVCPTCNGRRRIWQQR